VKSFVLPVAPIADALMHPLVAPGTVTASGMAGSVARLRGGRRSQARQRCA
jgi:hypothetical protein